MRFLLALLLCAPGLGAAAPLTLAAAQARPGLGVTITGGAPLVVTVKNQSPEAVVIGQAAGLICKAEGGASRIITLRALELTVAANAEAEATVPAALLSADPPTGSLVPTAETEPRLAPLLAYLATRNDLPRLTAQLLVRCILEDPSFAAWQRAIGIAAGTEPAPEQVIAVIDALGVLRQITPERTFKLATDPELKLRALRNPVARGKAMKLYGIDLPEAPLPPDLGTLLHTKTGDNCPICRQRALMQPPADGL